MKLLLYSAVRGWFARDYYAKLKERAMEARIQQEIEAQRLLEEELERQRKEQEAQDALNAKVEEAETSLGSVQELMKEAAKVSPTRASADLVRAEPSQAQDVSFGFVDDGASVLNSTCQSVQSIKANATGESKNLDDMFSFLEDFNEKPDLTKMADNITSEIDTLLDKPAPLQLQVTTSPKSVTQLDVRKTPSGKSPITPGRLKSNPLERMVRIQSNFIT
jgi:DNA-binding protein H-NS